MKWRLKDNLYVNPPDSSYEINLNDSLIAIVTTLNLRGYYYTRMMYKDIVNLTFYQYDAMIFMIDVADKNWIKESINEFKHILRSFNSINNNKLKILILGNKIDKINKGYKCKSKKELMDLIGITHTNICHNALPICCDYTIPISQRKETLNKLKIKTRCIIMLYIYGKQYNKIAIPIDLINICVEYLGLIGGNLLDNHTNIEIFMCSLITKEGLKEAFIWLSNQLEHQEYNMIFGD